MVLLMCRLLLPVLLAVHASAYYRISLPGPQSGLDGAQVLLASSAQGLEAPRRTTSYAPPCMQDVVNPVLDTLTAAELEEDLRALTSFHTRQGKSENGRKSEKWLLSKVMEIADTLKLEDGPDIDVEEFHHDIPQSSIIARFHGANTSDTSVAILGAHQDSKNYRDPTARAPGADDDGSGTVTILSAFRALARAGFKPQRTVEFHWYAAEEDRSLGSHHIAQTYKERGVAVAAMVEFDMTAWVKNGTREVIGVVSSDTDLGLTAWQAQLVETYTDVPSLVYRLPGTVGSDHMSWTSRGYPASFLTESHYDDSDPHIHTPNDTIDVSPEFSFAHMLHFAKLATAFAMEMGGQASDK